jgi:hypothetical protein
VTRERRRRCTDGEVAAALACLDQKARPLPTSRWPGDLSDLEQPGLYAWWVSAAGASQLASGLQHELQAGRIYAGQTGATACPPASSGPPPWPSASPGTTCADASAGRRSGSRSRRACGRRSTWSRPARSCWLANPRRGSASGSASTSPSRSLGGCDHPDCVVPLCRVHHRRYDRGQLDLLPYLEPRFRAELQHGLGHLGLLGLLRRLTECRWTPVAERSDEGERAA